jgi:adenine-specific DNA-methyltransferase
MVCGQNSIILDFFSGSATTAHAVMQLNSEDGGNRKYICVQIPEPTPENSIAFREGYQTIPEIGQERIRRAGDKIITENQHLKDKLDIGFKVFSLDESNINSYDINSNNLQTQLPFAQDNFKSNANPLDIVYEILLKQGLDLSCSNTQHQIDKTTIYNIDNGVMFVVLGGEIKSEVANFIIKNKKENVKVVFQDSKFASDSEKLNILENLNANGIENTNILNI